MVLGIIRSPFEWLAPSLALCSRTGGLHFDSALTADVRKISGAAVGRRTHVRRRSIPHRNTFGSQRLLNTRPAAQTFRISRVSGKPASHVVAGSHTPSKKNEPKRIDDGVAVANRVVLLLQLLLDLRKAPLEIRLSTLLDGRVILLVENESLRTKQLRVRNMDGVR